MYVGKPDEERFLRTLTALRAEVERRKKGDATIVSH
jgi:hypothetical protein